MNLNGFCVRKNIIGFLCVLVVTAIMVAGLCSFNSWPGNKVK